MEKRYLLHFFIVLAIIFVGYRIQTIDFWGVAKKFGFSMAKDQVMQKYAEQSESINAYNREHGNSLNIDELTQFLNENIKDAGLNPGQFEYHVGNNWFVLPVNTQNYAFVMPSDAPVVPKKFNEILKDAGLTIESLEKPSYALNIVDLNKILPTYDSSSDQYNDYRLQVVKTLIAAKFDGVFPKDVSQQLKPVESYKTDSTIDYILTNALGILSDIASYVSFGISQAVNAAGYAFGMASSAQKSVALQFAIDEYVIKSVDIGLLDARIKDLEEQVKAEETAALNSRFSFVNKYLPTSLQWGKLGYTEKVLQFLKKYRAENEFELKMLPKFKKNQKLKQQSS